MANPIGPYYDWSTRTIRSGDQTISELDWIKEGYSAFWASKELPLYFNPLEEPKPKLKPKSKRRWWPFSKKDKYAVKPTKEQIG